MASYCGVDLGGTKIQTVIVDDAREVLGSSRRATPASGGPPDVAAAIAASVREASEAAGVGAGELAGIGVGSPGTVEDGNVVGARNLPGWDGAFALADTLQAALGSQVRLGNDVQVATNAEYRLGSGRGFASLLGVFWGTGVGGGLILNGEPWSGSGGAGEIGHMVVKIGGARCTCGRRGCMEAYAGRAAMEGHAKRMVDKGRKTDLFKLMRERGRTRLTSGVWAQALEQHDKLATELIDRASRRARRGNRIGDQPARGGRGDHRRRPGRALRRGLRDADRRGDAAASFHRLSPSADAGWPSSAISAGRSARRCWSMTPAASLVRRGPDGRPRAAIGPSLRAAPTNPHGGVTLGVL